VGKQPQTDPEVVSVAHWGGVRPRVPFPPRGALDHLVLHHTGYRSTRIGGTSVEAQSRHLREIERWHLDRGFLGIGYHFVISPTGRIFRGRPVDRMGAHVEGHNRGTVGICLMGDFERERPTVAALAALAAVRTRLVPGATGLPLVGHREHSGQATLCPGRFLMAYLSETNEGRLAAALEESVDLGSSVRERRSSASSRPRTSARSTRGSSPFRTDSAG
jgi:N-acetylmuramoyl-L-alanine amidase